MERLIRRYRDSTRINHWIVALLFICAGLTGLAFFHPVFYWLTALFGGGPLSRILHPIFGVLMALGFVFLFFQVWRENLWQRRDTEWVKKSPQLIRGHEDAMPEVGKYNAGQKGVFWLFTVCLFVLLVTGFMFWQPWFADFFSIPLRRVAVLLHAIAAFVLILGAIVHIYAAIWVKGSTRAMTRGVVTETWARHHHPAWYREVRDGSHREG
ncbi:MAG: formate dehydrogenase subunit gamma [Burkholderiaceae bacterium]